jgi:hypothetical protein
MKAGLVLELRVLMFIFLQPEGGGWQAWPTTTAVKSSNV